MKKSNKRTLMALGVAAVGTIIANAVWVWFDADEKVDQAKQSMSNGGSQSEAA